MNKSGKQSLIGCVTIILIIIAIIIVTSAIKSNKESKIKELIGSVEQYGSMKGEFKAKPAASPLKVFIVQNRDKTGSKGEKYEYSSLYFDIAEDLRAKTPSEMNTLIQLNRTTSATGKYNTGKIAYSRYIDVTVIDIASGNVILTDQFIGSPPQTLVGNQEPYGDWPNSDVRDLIKDLAGGYYMTPSPDPFIITTPDVLE